VIIHCSGELNPAQNSRQPIHCVCAFDKSCGEKVTSDFWASSLFCPHCNVDECCSWFCCILVQARLCCVYFCVISAEFGDIDPQLHGTDYLNESHLLPKVMRTFNPVWSVF